MQTERVLALMKTGKSESVCLINFDDVSFRFSNGFRSLRFLQLVKMTKEVPKTLYLVLGCRLSGDHGQDTTLSYDT